MPQAFPVVPLPSAHLQATKCCIANLKKVIETAKICKARFFLAKVRNEDKQKTRKTNNTAPNWCFR